MAKKSKAHKASPAKKQLRQNRPSPTVNSGAGVNIAMTPEEAAKFDELIRWHELSKLAKIKIGEGVSISYNN